MDAFNTYIERQSAPNDAEVLFEAMCEDKGWKFYRVGFDEKSRNVDQFFRLTPLLRNLPDYYLLSSRCAGMVQVKGTDAIKKLEYDLIPAMIEAFASPTVDLYYCFLMKNRETKFKTAKEVMDLYEKERDQIWPDGVMFRRLSIWD
jgi:hypothetical protein